MIRSAFLLALAATACTEPSAVSNDQGAAPSVPDGIAATPAPAGAATPMPAPAAAGALTAERWGPLRIGMARAQVVGALGEDANPGAVGGAEPSECDEFHPARAPKGLMVMIEQGVLTRIALLRDATIPTDRGVKLGATVDQVKAAYGGAIEASAHKYAPPPAAYLTVWARGGGSEYVEDAAARGIRYVIGGDGRVAAIHAGGPSIQYVEGCA